MIKLLLPSLKKYETFLEDNILGIGLLTLEDYYDGIVNIMKNDFVNSPFFKKVNDSLNEFNDEYLIKTGYKLFSNIESLNILTKPFNSMICKCYRNDVVDNEKWKNADFNFESNYEWINPLKCFEVLNDIVRTRICVRYVDSVVFVLEKLISLTNEFNLFYEHSYKAEEEGYYAIHFNLIYPFNIYDINYKAINVKSKVEFQIVTDIQNLITELTHKYYEKRRMLMEKTDEKWQWDFECEEFIPNYLGHIVHYIEGMIMEVRERK